MMQQQKKKSYPKLKYLWISAVSDVMGFSLLLSVFPSLLSTYQLNPFQIGLIMAINGLFSFFSAPIWGKLSDKHGRKPMLIISQFGTIIGFLVLGFSNSISIVILSRIIDGIFGGNFPIVKAIINDVVEPRDLPKQYTNLAISHSFANIFGPALSGILYVNFGIIGPGILASTICAISLILVALKVPETAPVKTGHHVKFNPSKMNLKKSELNNKNWYQNPTLRSVLVIYAVLTFSAMIITTNYAMFGLIKLSLDAEQMGYIMMVMGISNLSYRFLVYNRVLDKWGIVNLVLFTFPLFIITYILFGFATSWLFLLILILMQVIATSTAKGGLSSFIGRLVNPKERGKVQGIASSLDTFGQVIGPTLGGLLLTYLPFEMFGLVSVILISIGLIIFLQKGVINVLRIFFPVKEKKREINPNLGLQQEESQLEIIN